MEPELVVRQGPADLRGRVDRLWGYASDAGAPARTREPVATGVVLIVGLDTELRLLDPDRPAAPPVRVRSFAAGLADRCALLEHDGLLACVQVDLSPPAARMLFGVPMHELAGAVASLDDLLGREGALLEERVSDAPSWEARFAVVDAVLRRRLERAVAPPADVEWAWRRLRETHGRLRVSELARELGCSRKHLAARFRDHVGVPPKLAARIQRFRRAQDLLAEPDAPSTAAVAFACGYFDEAHLDRDFRAFARTTPGAYRADPHAVTFVQDAVFAPA